MKRCRAMKWIAMVLVLLALGNLQTPAAAESALSSGDFDYQVISDNSAVITRYRGKEKKLTLPAELDGHPVTGVGYLAFSMNADLVSVVIPDSVVTIEGNPWYNCGELTSIEVAPGNPVLAAVDGMLYDQEEHRLISFPSKSKKNKIAIPDGIQSIGENALAWCRNLKNVTIPDSVTYIGHSAFNGCKNLTDIRIPDSVTRIDARAFESCESLTRVMIPDSVAEIGINPWRNCSRLVSFEISQDQPILEIIDGALCRKDNKELVCYPCGRKDSAYVIPDGIQAIGGSAFDCCQKLSQVTIPEGVKYIGDNAFSLCKNLKSVSVPGSAERIGREAFDHCETLTDCLISDGVICIDESAFKYCKSLVRMLIPDSVTRIGDRAFMGCERLREVTIPDSVTEIGSGVFERCGSLERIIVSPGSYAETYCVENKLPCAYPEGNN